MERAKVFSGAPWEQKVGYCRALKVGNQIFVAGTTAVNEVGILVGEGNAYQQAKFILAKIEKALQELGADMKDVVRTRTFITDISKWEEVGKAHGEYFSTVFPVATMVEVSGLIEPKMLVEIEVDAVIV